MKKWLLLLAVSLTAISSSAQEIDASEELTAEQVNASPFAFEGIGRACFFADVNYSGASFCVSGAQRIDNLIPSGWNDTISSVRIEGPIVVSLYRDTGFEGGSLRLRSSNADLRDLRDWNDQASSISTAIEIVFPIPVNPAPRGQVCFFSDVNYQGNKLCVRTGRRVSNLIPSGWNDTISSVAVGSGARATIYEDVKLKGASLNIRSSVKDLRTLDWNDRASSLRVRAR